MIPIFLPLTSVISSALKLQQILAVKMNRAARNPAGLLDQLHDAHGCRRFTAAGLTDQRKDFSFLISKLTWSTACTVPAEV